MYNSQYTFFHLCSFEVFLSERAIQFFLSFMKPVLILQKIKTKSLPVEISGGAILSNKFVGITSNAVKAPLSQSLASVGGSIIDFSKHVKSASRNVQKKKDKVENIRFIY